MKDKIVQYGSPDHPDLYAKIVKNGKGNQKSIKLQTLIDGRVGVCVAEAFKDAFGDELLEKDFFGEKFFTFFRDYGFWVGSVILGKETREKYRDITHPAELLYFHLSENQYDLYNLTVSLATREYLAVPTEDYPKRLSARAQCEAVEALARKRRDDILKPAREKFERFCFKTFMDLYLSSK